MTLLKSALSLGSIVGARQLTRGIQHLGTSDLLGVVGLERRRSAVEKLLPAVGWFGLGTALGAGAALLLAPTSGKELRTRVTHQLGEAKQRLDEEIRAVEHRAREAAPGNGR